MRISLRKERIDLDSVAAHMLDYPYTLSFMWNSVKRRAQIFQEPKMLCRAGIALKFIMKRGIFHV